MMKKTTTPKFKKFSSIYKKLNQIVRENLLASIIIIAIILFIIIQTDEKTNNPINEQVADDSSQSFMAESISPMSKMIAAPARIMPSPIASGYDNSANDRMIIKNASLNIEVTDTEKTREEVEITVASFTGRITNVNSWQDNRGNSLAYNFTIRVPSKNLDGITKQLSELGTKQYESFSENDITEQYQDTIGQLKNLYARRDRLRKMMETQTKQVADILEVDRELNNTQIQIENLERVQTQQKSDSDFSNLNLTITPEPKISNISTPNWTVNKAWKDAINNMINFMQTGVSKILMIIAYAPLWIPIVIIFWFIRRKKTSK